MFAISIKWKLLLSYFEWSAASRIISSVVSGAKTLDSTVLEENHDDDQLAGFTLKRFLAHTCEGK